MKTRNLGCLVLALAMLASVPPAFAELNAYLSVTGQKQGTIRGSVTQRGREGSIMVVAVSHEVTWGGRGDLTELTGQPLRVQLQLGDGEVYSLGFGE